MISQNNAVNSLILLSLISFGFFGSLSHLFNLILLIFILTIFLRNNQKLKIEAKSLFIYFCLTGVFFLFLINSFFHPNILFSIKSLSTMFPIPIIGLLILFRQKSLLEIKSSQLSTYSQISIFFAFIMMVFFSFVQVEKFITLYEENPRLTLFSGNPIPFSFSIVGLSIFCIADWHVSSIKKRSVGLVCLALGFYLAGFLSGTRSTLLAILIIAPIIIFYLTKNKSHALLAILSLALLNLVIIYLHLVDRLTVDYLFQLENGLKTLFSSTESDRSIALRLEMWSAAIKSINSIPIFGYNITERFDAISPYLSETFNEQFSHPHNDILASIISAGFIGGFTAAIALFSAILPSIIEKEGRLEKFYLGTMIVITVLSTANFSTVFFNDISSAWLAFSTFLLWNTNFKK